MNNNSLSLESGGGDSRALHKPSSRRRRSRAKEGGLPLHVLERVEAHPTITIAALSIELKRGRNHVAAVLYALRKCELVRSFRLGRLMRWSVTEAGRASIRGAREAIAQVRTDGSYRRTALLLVPRLDDRMSSLACRANMPHRGYDDAIIALVSNQARTMRELADALGSRREVITNVCRRLKAEGRVDVERFGGSRSSLCHLRRAG